MRIAILAAGSRGDYQPVLAVAAQLRERGHHVGITATTDFADLIGAHGFEVEEVRIEVMRDYRDRISARMPESMPDQMAVLGRWLTGNSPHIAQTMRQLWPRYDAVVSTALTMSWACALSAVDRRPHVTMLFVPGLPTGWGDASMLSVRPGWSWANLAAGLRAFGAANQVVMAGSRELGQGLTRVQRVRAVRLMFSTPALIAQSPQLIAPRRISGRRLRPTGYPFRELPSGARLSRDTEAFLAQGSPPVYVGFGSQGAPVTHHAKRLAIDAALEQGERVISLGGAGLDELTDDARVRFVDDEPHELLFPRVSTVIHHGGAGTTAQALRSGVPQVVMPFMIDQPFFGRRCHEIGVASPPVPIREATRERLLAALVLASSESVRQRAVEVGRLVTAERGAATAADFVEQSVGVRATPERLRP